ncbi:MAG: septum formation initiator family protein [Hyphomonadaceae bacterium]
MGKVTLKRVLQVAAAVLIVVLAVGLYRAKSDAAKTEADVRRLNGEIAEREARLRELRAEIAELESPARIEQLSEQRLGLVVGGESVALPEAELARLPAPQPQQQKAGE